ncbi:MAG: hypothetical protein FJZ56_00010 [Chlamydiae bacterium]|nr:hypothetical protein [Chlamydiota bacterium]
MLFLANTCFELELENPDLPFKDLFSFHPNFIQLQYLPTAIASEKDFVITSSNPSSEYLEKMKQQGFSIPNFLLLDNLKETQDVFLWGQTTNTMKMFPHLACPSIDSILKVSSKLFAHELSPLPGSFIVKEEKELEHLTDGIIKLPHGFSGRGNFPVFAKNRRKNLKFPVLYEPLKKRILDFATHWHILDGNLQFIGATEGRYTPTGSYIANIAPLKHCYFLEKQKEFVWENIQKIIDTKYFGPFSIDAMVYEDSKEKLQPIIEINPRRTMGSFCWMLKEKLGVKSIEIRYEKNVGQPGLLPSEKNFPKQLIYDIYK